MNLKTKEEYLAFMMAGAFARGLCEMDTNPEKYRDGFNTINFHIDDEELFEQIAIKYMPKYENTAAKILDILEQYGENDKS